MRDEGDGLDFTSTLRKTVLWCCPEDLLWVHLSKTTKKNLTTLHTHTHTCSPVVPGMCRRSPLEIDIENVWDTSPVTDG